MWHSKINFSLLSSNIATNRRGQLLILLYLIQFLLNCSEAKPLPEMNEYPTIDLRVSSKNWNYLFQKLELF